MNSLYIICILIVAGAAGCVDSAPCSLGIGGATVETQTVLTTYCNETAAKYTLYELKDLEPYYNIWCLKHTYVINNSISKEEILIGTIATRKPGKWGPLEGNTYEARELKGPYQTCEGRL